MAKVWTLESLEKLSDKELLLTLSEGEKLALDCLYFRHSAKVNSLALKNGLNPEKADEAVQITFLQLYRKKHLYNPEHEAIAWLYVIAKSEIRDLRRRESKFKSNLNDPDQVLSQIPSSAPNVDEHFESQKEVDKALQTLKPQEKAALEMRYLQDKNFSEIAKALKTSEGNIRQIISRTLRKLANKGGQQ